jgi:dipeptidyl aminopeptidase/acylaminoacyl peptidase
MSLQLSLSPDGHYVYYLDDKQGNEIGHCVRLSFEGSDSPVDVTPDLPQYSSLAGDPAFAINRAGTVIGFTTDAPDGFRLFCMDVEADGKLGQPRLLRSCKKLAAGPQLTYDGKIAFWATSERSTKEQFSILAIDTGTGEKIGELWDGPDSSLDYQAIITSPINDDHRIVTATNRTGEERLLVWNPNSSDRIDLQIDVEGSMRAFDWSPNGERILFRNFNKAVQQLYVYNLSNSEVSKLNHPSGTNSAPYFWSDSEIWSHWEDPTHPRRLIALDAQTGVQTRVVLSIADAQTGHPLRSVTFVSSDGQEVQGWLGTPDGKGPFPTILETHGGPKSVTCPTYSPESQAWIDNGFAFFSINYRGSVTFGREFEEKIYGNPGFWELEDMVAARNWLVQAGLGRPDMILLTGGSYGGYLTLQALGKRPDLWAGGMAEVAIADWRGLYEDASDTMRAWAVALLGGRPDEKPEQYAASSPITYVENVRAPVLIIQGRKDTRTPTRPVEMYEERMKALNKNIQVHWFDTGHLGSIRQVEVSIEHQDLMLRFALGLVGLPSKRKAGEVQSSED